MSDVINEQLKAEINATLVKAGSADYNEAIPAQRAIAAAITTPLREAVFSGDIVTDLFAKESYDESQGVPEYPIDLIVPGTEGEYTAFTMPDHGRIPSRKVESDRVFVNTFRIANGIECNRSFLRRANWNVIQRMVQILEAGFVKKINDDGWHTILAAAAARNILVFDADAAQGQFTPRLVTLAKTIMRRNGGGNSTSINRGKLTHLYVSPEAKDDVRHWALNLVPDAVRAQIFYSGDNETMKLFDVEIRDIDELGVGQEYQTYFTGTLGKSLATSDDELVVGFDKAHNDSFVMPVTKELELFEDNTLHREGLFGMYGDAYMGFAALDLRRSICASF